MVNIKMKKLIPKVFIATFLLGILMVVPLVSAVPTYEPSVFSPNNTIYDINVHFRLTAVNATDGSTMMIGELGLLGNLTLFSERLNMSFVKWSERISLDLWMYHQDTESFANETQNITAYIPPLLAVEENTRKIYIAQLDFENFDGGDSQDIINNLSSVTFRSDVYALNPFYIPTSTELGDSILIGAFNITSGENVSLAFSISSDRSYNARDGHTYDVWVANPGFSTLYDVFQGIQDIIPGGGGDNGPTNLLPMFGEEEPQDNESEMNTEQVMKDVLGNITFNWDLLYDKASGWLLANLMTISGGGTVFYNDTIPVVNYTANGFVNLELRDAGSVKIGGSSLLSRFSGVSDNMLFGADVLLVAAVLVYLFMKKKK